MSHKRKKPSTTEQPVVIDKTINKFSFSFLNQYQKDCWDTIAQSDVTFVVGPAGSGKSQIAAAYAAKALLDKRCRKIVLSRPCVATESLGYLPGDANDKISPYLAPLLDCLSVVVGNGPERKRVDESISFVPLAFQRGLTWDYSVAILDEAQNCTYEQLKLFTTRIGKRTKMIITGDITQCDIKNSGLPVFLERLHNVEGVSIVDLPPAAIVRHPIISKIIKALGDQNG